jgi:hypothetical protein
METLNNVQHSTIKNVAGLVSLGWKGADLEFKEDINSLAHNAVIYIYTGSKTCRSISYKINVHKVIYWYKVNIHCR